MTFRVGQKVCCVDGMQYPPDAEPFSVIERPVEGAVYTVTRCFIFAARPCVHLLEIARDVQSRLQHGNDVGYGAWRFRPIVSRITDISTLTALLVPGAKIREDA